MHHYSEGGFPALVGLADVLPVRRDWAAIQLSHLESVRDVMQAWAQVSGYLKR